MSRGDFRMNNQFYFLKATITCIIYYVLAKKNVNLGLIIINEKV